MSGIFKLYGLVCTCCQQRYVGIYVSTRIYDETPVYCLDCHTFKIEKIETTGDKPGWVSLHKAYYKESNKIYITGGKLWLMKAEKAEYIDNSLD